MSVEIVDIFGNSRDRILEFVDSESMEELHGETELEELSQVNPYRVEFFRGPNQDARLSQAVTSQDADIKLGAEKFSDANERFKTFDRWCKPFIKRTTLAEMGFYYLRAPDWVKCHFCQIELGHWTVFDDIFREHKKWSPACRFIRGLPTNNIPINRDLLERIIPSITEHTFYSNNAVSEGSIISKNENPVKGIDEGKEKCRICMDEAINVVLLPCGHVLGANCVAKISDCPFCRSKVLNKNKIYFS
jgi:hypothetical protein